MKVHPRSNGLWFLIIILFFSCSNPEVFTIEGKFDNSKSKKVYLAQIINREIIPIDSSSISASGGFKFETKPKLPIFYSILSDALQIVVMGEKGTSVFLKADLRDSTGNYLVYGSDENKKLFNLNLSRIHGVSDMKKLMENSLHASTAQDSASIFREAAQIQSRFLDTVKTFIHKNKNSFSGFYALNFLDPDQDFSSYQILSQNAGVKFKGNPLADTLQKLVEQQFPLSIGQMAPEIKLPDPNGLYQSTSSLKGKYVLVDFWASWCAPCRKENPYNRALYNQFKDLGFTIFSVSLDKDKASWINGIKEDGLPWTQVSDLKYWNSEVVETFHFNSIPHNFLLGPDGKILAKNLHGSALKDFLAQTLGIKKAI